MGSTGPFLAQGTVCIVGLGLQDRGKKPLTLLFLWSPENISPPTEAATIANKPLCFSL